MPRSKHYSPAICRFLVSVLYHESKGRGVPMTVLANQILETGLAGTDGWKRAEEARLQEPSPTYKTEA